MYPQTKAAWNHNTKACNKTPYQYFESIQNYLLKKKPKFFRWHVSGDSPDERYFEHLRYVALMTPDTEHLIFTKRYKFNYRNLPSNLHVVFSMWNKYGNTRKKMPRAWMRDPKNPDPRIPNDAIECPGNCESCGMCWSLDKIGKDVVFNKH
ncbi:MAG: hypothetical protein DRI61_03460 [Chloroflexi bacterium]|nr:MAG: hypothetical protein DRI61_03460 [Chloroflexota bacterium]